MRTAHDGGWETFVDVDFTYVPAEDANCTADNQNVLFDVNPITGAKYTARSFFPNEARIHRNILIDDTAFQPHGPLTLVGVVEHELGHILGFRHEHIRPEAANVDEDCVEDDRFRGVTPYDSASIMHYPQCHGSTATLAFTARDKEGAVLIYGAPGSGPPPETPAPAPAPEVEQPEQGADAGDGGCAAGGGGASLAFGALSLALVRRRYQRT
jgi:serine protease